MRKSIKLTLTMACLAMALTACGGSDKDSDDKKDKKTTEEVTDSKDKDEDETGKKTTAEDNVDVTEENASSEEEVVEIPKVIFASEAMSNDSIGVYMLLTNSEGKLIPRINERSYPDYVAEAETVMMTTGNLGLDADEGDSTRTNLHAYQYDEDTVIAIENEAIGAAGPNCPNDKTEIHVYDISVANGFTEVLSVKASGKYGEFSGDSIYNFTERKYYNLATNTEISEDEFNSMLAEYGMTTTEETLTTNELRDKPQEYTTVGIVFDAPALYEITSRDGTLPELFETVKEQCGISGM